MASRARTLEQANLSVAALIKPAAAEIWLLVAAVIVGIIAVGQGVAITPALNAVPPTLLSLAMLVGLYLPLRRTPETIWSPLIWLRLVLLVYFGAGSMIYVAASDDLIGYLDSFFAVYPADYAKYNLVMASFALAMTIGAAATAFIASFQKRRGLIERSIAPCVLPLLPFAYVALAFGVAATFVLYWYALITGEEVGITNNLLASLGNASGLAYALLTYHAFKYRKFVMWFAIVIPFALLDIIRAVITFEKSGVFIVLIFIMIGLFAQRFTLTRLVIMAGMCALILVTLQPLISYGRLALAGRPASIAISGAIIDDFLNGHQQSRVEDDQFGGVSRIAYYNAAAFAITEYDRGRPGDSWSIILPTITPRFLFPDKGNITAVGAAFNFLVNGNDTSQSSPTIPAEAYWNIGWPGPPLIGLLYGLGFGIASLYSLTALRRSAWHLLLPALVLVRSATRIDGYLAVDFCAPLLFVALMHFGLAALNALAWGRGGAAPAPAAWAGLGR